jgi:hypothetical protein
VIAPILFTGVYLVDGATRTGYEPLRHQVSLLSLGDRGWVQVLSFLLTGALLVVFAIALRARLRPGPGARGCPLGIAVSGTGFILAGVFTTQPMFGYPPGAPAGMATDITPTSAIHVMAAMLLFFGLVGAAAVHASRSWRTGDRGWAAASATVAVVVLVAFGASGGGPSGELLLPAYAGLVQRIALVIGLGWVLALALQSLQRAAAGGPMVA